MTSAQTPVTDEAVEQALAVYDTLTADEQRNVFGAVARAVAEYGRTRNVDPLVGLAESVEGMVRLETRDPGAREAIRAAAGRRPPADPREGVALDEAVKELREA